MPMFSVSDSSNKYRKAPAAIWDVQAHSLRSVLREIFKDSSSLKKYYSTIRPRLYDETFIPSVLLEVPPIELLSFEEKSSAVINFHEQVENTVSASDFKPIVLLSPIGRGKSTFIHYSAKVQFPQKLKISNIKFIIINVRDGFSTDISLFRSKLIKSIDYWLIENYTMFNIIECGEINYFNMLCDIYKRELLERGLPITFQDAYMSKQVDLFNELREDSEDFIRRRIDLLEDNIILVVDNLDQFLKYYQERAFVDSFSVAVEIQCPLIVSLRDTSFEYLAAAEVFNAYDVDFLNLSLPLITDVIKKRISILKGIWRNELKGPDKSWGVLYNGSQFTVKKQKTLEQGIEILEYINSDKYKERIAGLLSNLSNYNVREIIRNLKIIFSSYHSFAPLPERYYTYKSFRKSEITYPKIIMALMLLNSPFYKEPSTAPIVNLFENYTTSHTNYFLRIRLLQYLRSRKLGVKINQMLEYFISTFNEESDIIGNTLELLIKKGLIALMPPPMQENIKDLNYLDYMDHKLMITNSGYYHLNTLIYYDIYIDEIKYSTTINRDIYRKVFVKDFHKSIDTRMESTTTFLEYLKDKEIEENQYRVGANQYSIFYGVTEKMYERYTKKMETL